MVTTSPTSICDFYVSYSAPDEALAERVRHCLEQLGHEVEMRDARPNVAPPERLAANGRLLQRARNLIAVYTARYKNDAEAHNELFSSFARAKSGHDHDYILVVFDCEPDINFQASTYIDLRPVADDQHAEHVKRVVQKRKGTSNPKAPPKKNLDRLPASGNKFFGRRRELNELKQKWDDPRARLVEVRGGTGGEGKTSLALEFLKELERENFHFAKGVFGYSFGGQGSAEAGARATSAEFFTALLEWLDATVTFSNDIDKGREVARLVAGRRVILVLDGMEPLLALAQDNPGDSRGPTPPRVTDLGLGSFLFEFMNLPTTRARILATTRIGLNPFLRTMLRDGHPGDPPEVILELLQTRFWEKELAGLEDHDAAAVLQHHLENPAPTQELIEVARDYCKNDPLTLNLFGKWIQTEFQGDLARRTEFAHRLAADTSGQPQAAVLTAFSSSLTAPEKQLMNLVGLFDRPVPRETLEKTFFTGPGAALFRQTWAQVPKSAVGQDSLSRLVSGLVYKSLLNPVGEGAKQEIDTHPLIRNYYSTQFETSDRPLWQKAHQAIYTYMTGSVPSKPKKRDELLVLYRAIPHGILGGWATRTGWMYAMRCLQGYRAYSTNTHNMLSEDLEMISHYFEGRWDKLRTDGAMSYFERSNICQWAGILLANQGRGQEGVRLVKDGLADAKKAQDFLTASLIARHLAQLYEFTGRLDRADEFATEGVELSDKARVLGFGRILTILKALPGSLILLLGDRTKQRVACRLYLANIRRQRDKLDEARALCEEARQIQHQKHRNSPVLKGFWGFRLGQTLISRGEYDEAVETAQRARADHDKPAVWVEGIHAKLNHLIEGHARLKRLQTGHDEDPEAIKKLLVYPLDGADGQSGFRRSSQYWLLIPGLLMLAEAQRTFAKPNEALATLQEAQKLITALNMETYRLDLLFESAQFLARFLPREAAATAWLKQRFGEAESARLLAGDPRAAARKEIEACLEGCTKAGYALLHRHASAWASSR